MSRQRLAVARDATGYYRANRAGAMVIVMTLCQYGIPALFFSLMPLFGADTQARYWGLPTVNYLCVYLLMYLLMMGIPMLLSALFLVPKAKHRLSPMNLSLDRKVCIVLCGVALCLLANILAALFSNVLYDAGVARPDIAPPGDGSIVLLLMDLLVFAVVPAVMEETLLRGMVLQTLRPLGNGVAVLTSALLFGLMHGNVSQTPYAILMGLILGTVFIHTDDLRLTILIHGLANGISVVAGFLLQFFDTDFATFWELVMLIVTLMMGGVAGLWLWRHPRDRHPPAPAASFAARRKALVTSPLLWTAIAIMLIGILIRL